MSRPPRARRSCHVVPGSNPRMLQKAAGLEADEVILAMLKELFSGRHDAIKVMALKDLYELLEKVIDRCRDTGNVITHIVLKNS